MELLAIVLLVVVRLSLFVSTKAQSSGDNDRLTIADIVGISSTMETVSRVNDSNQPIGAVTTDRTFTTGPSVVTSETSGPPTSKSTPTTSENYSTAGQASLTSSATPSSIVTNSTESSTTTSTAKSYTTQTLIISTTTTETVAPTLPVATGFHFANVTYTSFNATWKRPYRNHGTADVKDYILHYYLTRDINDDTSHHRVLLGANETWYVISDVRSGTSYSAHLISRFVGNSRNPALTSTTNNIDVLTKGFGTDHPCPCDAQGAVNRTLCDQGTGHCIMCKSQYEGEHCEKCIPGYYRFIGKPCQPCPCDKKKSTGNCTVMTVSKVRQIVECHCSGKRIGQFCQYCDNGYFTNKTTQQCYKCSCNGNEKLNSNKICNSVTGRCYNCKYNTTGFHCERCLPGYEGDPIVAKNCTLLDLPFRGRHPTITENKNVVMGVTATFGSILLIIIFIIGCKKYHNWRRWQPQPFWTVELKDDHETVSFSSMVEQDYQNVDAALLIDDVNYYDRGLSGQLRVGSPEPVTYNSINA